MSDSESETDKVSVVESEESNEESNKEAPAEALNELKENVTYYLKIDDAIRDKKDEIKELVEKRIKYEDFIRRYLERTNKTKIDTKDGEITFKKSAVKAPIKEDIVEKAIVSTIKDLTGKKLTDGYIKVAHDILEEVDNMRDVKVKNNLRRTKKKQHKKK